MLAQQRKRITNSFPYLNSDEIEDIIQSCRISVHKNYISIEGCTLRNYVARAATNTALDFLRTKNRKKHIHYPYLEDIETEEYGREDKDTTDLFIIEQLLVDKYDRIIRRMSKPNRSIIIKFLTYIQLDEGQTVGVKTILREMGMKGQKGVNAIRIFRKFLRDESSANS